MRPSAAAGMWSCSLETKFKAAAEVYRKALSLNTDDLFKPHKSQRPSKSVETPPNCFEYQNKQTEKNISSKQLEQMEQRWRFAIKKE